MYTTREHLQEGIKETSTWVAAAFIGAGVVMSITLVFMPLGMWLVIAGAGVFVMGYVLAWILPWMLRFHRVICPYCQGLNLVRANVREFCCWHCTRPVKVKKGGNAMLTLIRPHRLPAPAGIQERKPVRRQEGSGGDTRRSVR
ncbi:MAG: hypothetical protein D9V47_02515 [Clostridia bacterium]|nr:MAG: hypothetical protein D9V47_02515 [Clostridia bacterium]